MVLRGSDTKLIYGDQAEGIQLEKTSPIINDKRVTSVGFSLQTKTASAHTAYPLTPLPKRERFEELIKPEIMYHHGIFACNASASDPEIGS